jgi:putative membrane protein
LGRQACAPAGTCFAIHLPAAKMVFAPSHQIKELRMNHLGNVLAVLAVCVWPLATPAGQKSARPLDKDFLVKVASCNNAEIEISKLADSRANSAPVREFAAMLLKDHKAAYDKLGDLAKERKLGIAAGLEKETRDEIKRLSKLEGAEFDRAFLQHTIREHKKAISIFENQAKKGQEADIREYAKELLPDLRKHLSKAEELAKTAGQ